MGIETSTGRIDELNPAWPLADDSKSEAPAHFHLIKQTMKTWAGKLGTFAQGVITNKPDNTITLVGTGSDSLVPPAGYVAIPGFVQDLQSGLLTVSAGTFQIGLNGIFEARGWAAVKASTAGVTVSVVFGIERAGVITYSPRPTPVTLDNIGRFTDLAGGAYFKCLAGDIVRAYIAASANTTVTIQNANLSLAWKAENPDV